jgi:hypothetical protein
MQPIRVTKVLAAASSTGIGTFSSGGVVTLANSGGVTLDTARRVIVWGSSAVEAPILITGTNQFGTVISESVYGSSTPSTAVATTQDFLSVTSVIMATGVMASTTGYIGTSTNGGTPWVVVDNTRRYPNLNFQLSPTTTGIQASLEYTFDNISYPWVNPTSTSTGTNMYRSGAPFPVISSQGSSIAALTQGLLNLNPTAWRVTLSSSATGAGTIVATVIQSG